MANYPPVAEVLKVPLYVLDLGQVADEVEDNRVGRAPIIDENGRDRITVADAFSLAARWKALLLVDECDLYLEPRSESTPLRNRLVTSMSPLDSVPRFIIGSDKRCRIPA